MKHRTPVTRQLPPAKAACTRVRPKSITTLLAAIATASTLYLPAPAFASDFLKFSLENLDTIVKAGQHVRKSARDLTPKEEYYIGRAVTAEILAKYPPVKDPMAVNYLNLVGRYLSLYSSKPETYRGYHFILIRSNEINAFAAPGGFIMVTTGLFNRLKSEDELALVLAHEISHVTLQHGVSAIKQANLTQAFTLIADKAIEKKGGTGMRKLSAVFGESIGDIVNKLVVSGYSKEQEYEADQEALRIAYQAGYNPSGLADFLYTLQHQPGGNRRLGFYKTHPPAGQRLARVDETLRTLPQSATTTTGNHARLQSYQRQGTAVR